MKVDTIPFQAGFLTFFSSYTSIVVKARPVPIPVQIRQWSDQPLNPSAKEYVPLAQRGHLGHATTSHHTDMWKYHHTDIENEHHDILAADPHLMRKIHHFIAKNYVKPKFTGGSPPMAPRKYETSPETSFGSEKINSSSIQRKRVESISENSSRGINGEQVNTPDPSPSIERSAATLVVTPPKEKARSKDDTSDYDVARTSLPTTTTSKIRHRIKDKEVKGSRDDRSGDHDSNYSRNVHHKKPSDENHSFPNPPISVSASSEVIPPKMKGKEREGHVSNNIFSQPSSSSEVAIEERNKDVDTVQSIEDTQSHKKASIMEEERRKASDEKQKGSKHSTKKKNKKRSVNDMAIVTASRSAKPDSTTKERSANLGKGKSRGNDNSDDFEIPTSPKTSELPLFIKPKEKQESQERKALREKIKMLRENRNMNQAQIKSMASSTSSSDSTLPNKNAFGDTTTQEQRQKYIEMLKSLDEEKKVNWFLNVARNNPLTSVYFQNIGGMLWTANLTPTNLEKVSAAFKKAEQGLTKEGGKDQNPS